MLDPVGGAATQVYTVNADCSVTKGPVQFFASGTPAFLAYVQERRSRAGMTGVGPLTSQGASCNSELDYQDVAQLNLTWAQLWQGYSFDSSLGQVTSVGTYHYANGWASDGWYFIRQATYPYTGPIPWGTITSAYYAEFAWIGGSFWHSQQNNNQGDGFGQCTGWPTENGSIVPAGRWVWGTWSG